MTLSRTMIAAAGLLFTAAITQAQPPAPPARPAAPQPAAPVVAPVPAVAPMGAAAAWSPFDPQDVQELAERAKELADEAAAKAEFKFATTPFLEGQDLEDLKERAKELAKEQALNFKFELGDGMGKGIGLGIGEAIANAKIAASTPFVLKTPPFAFAPQIVRSGRSEDSLYNAGQRALDSHHWDEALGDFNQIISRGSGRIDAALYWKAYSLTKLNKYDDALAAIAELRKSHANSRWLDDAKALEVEINAKRGRPVSPEQESDEDLKLMAISGLMQSDPDRAIPLLENVLKSSQSPKVKQRALYVLAVSSTPRAQQVLEQVARGGSNPDLQVRAINELSTTRRRTQSSNPNLFSEIYAASNDVAVKRAILNAYSSSHDYEHLAQVARGEKDPDLRRSAFIQLGNVAGQPELWQIYQNESSPDVKVQILECMYQNGNADKLAEVVRNEKDPKVRSAAIRVLATQKASNTGELLLAAYGSTQDQEGKRTIIDHLYSQRNAKALVDLARQEKDPKMKLRIVERLGNMKSKEAQDYLMEILSK